ncbi:helix-turn-helix domain-containing protein [Pseudomonas syringae]|uniref:AraC family transcriptional regulator n=1 Tax=Pseudomonas syringae TaxID=317 RepID=UPI001F480934|nr:AraC family transcriptional regulator [Pseudomonas syringae]MCF8984891.1 helix-turn-helix domain-containing protein [Pseudomonas syringae]MCF9003827.1 helix-turn-helix domain-containing protein [Pseudomonas syringae]
MNDLLNAVSRYADANYLGGIAATPLPGLVILRETMPTALLYAISRPLVALVLQGKKRVSMGDKIFEFGAGESLIITADVPTVSQIIVASRNEPYLAFVVELDHALIESLVVEMGTAPFSVGEPLRVESTETEVTDAALRLLRLLDRPGSVSVLKNQLLRELHYWLLSGRHGGAIRALGIASSHAQRIGRTIARIRDEFAQPLRVEQLAETAGMSVSGFHTHFRTVTSLTPLQYQKQLRLIEARRRLLEGTPIANAAYGVGYESIPQFTREYGRMFGVSPAKDIREVKMLLSTSA